MALEDARKFLQMIEKDEDLKQRLSKMTIEESLEYARKSGLDVTIAELEKAAEPQEISPETMNDVVGGHKRYGFGSAPNTLTKCPATPSGEHQWEIAGREIEVRHFLCWEIHNRLDKWKCTACGKTKTTGA